MIEENNITIININRYTDTNEAEIILEQMHSVITDSVLTCKDSSSIQLIIKNEIAKNVDFWENFRLIELIVWSWKEEMLPEKVVKAIAEAVHLAINFP